MLADLTPTYSGPVVERLLFNDELPSPDLQLSIIVPVRDEADHLTRTLDALRCQITVSGLPINPAVYEVLLLVNNATDRSYNIAEVYQRDYPDFPLRLAQIQLPAHKANIGTVRRLLMDAACRRLLSVGNDRGIIASTDGDTVVDNQWLWYIMAEMAMDCDAVAGRIIAYPNNSPSRRFYLRDVTYRQLVAQAEALLDPTAYDPWPRHFQHFGASLAVTCQMYLLAGRLPEVPYLEDEAFYKALLRVDARIRKSPRVKVFTSPRLQGRVAVGFSQQLRCWTQMHDEQQHQLAESPSVWLLRFTNRQRLRTLWSQQHESVPSNALATIAEELGIAEWWLQEQWRTCQYFGQLWENVEATLLTGSGAWPLIPITEAIQELRTYLRPLTSAATSCGLVGASAPTPLSASPTEVGFGRAVDSTSQVGDYAVGRTAQTAAV